MNPVQSAADEYTDEELSRLREIADRSRFNWFPHESKDKEALRTFGPVAESLAGTLLSAERERGIMTYRRAFALESSRRHRERMGAAPLTADEQEREKAQWLEQALQEFHARIGEVVLEAFTTNSDVQFRKIVEVVKVRQRHGNLRKVSGIQRRRGAVPSADGLDAIMRDAIPCMVYRRTEDAFEHKCGTRNRITPEEIRENIRDRSQGRVTISDSEIRKWMKQAGLLDFLSKRKRGRKKGQKAVCDARSSRRN